MPKRDRRVLHIYSCGHRRRYPNALRDRTVRHEEACAACIARLPAELERAQVYTEQFLDNAHDLFTSMGRCIEQSARRI